MRGAATVAAGMLLLTGCGIRPTSVPVDAGPAPSRTTCTLSNSAVPSPTGGPASGKRDESLVVDPTVVYLVCNGHVDHVVRGNRISGSRVELAGRLLGELGRKPSENETRSGYETAVPAAVKVTGPRKGDPADTLRLEVALDDLPPLALGQIVCTFSHALAGSGPVRLAGSDDGPVREFVCDTRLRTDPTAGAEAGSPL